MGGGTTDLTIFRNGNPWFSSVIPLGGMQMTNDLAACLDLPPDVAEEVKLDWGHVMPQMLDPNEEATIPGIDGKPDWNISRRSICQPLHDRLEEILQLVLLRMQQAGLRNLPPGGLVVTGGCAEMPGFEEMLHSMVGKPARVAWPTDVAGLPSHLARPAFAAPLGTLIWGAKHEGRKRTYNGTDASWLEKLTFRRGRRESHEKEMALVTRR
jgi:cell division protein FtsA